jgi:hypothetical protein
MCTANHDGTATLCEWATETTRKAAIVRLSLTTTLSAEEIGRRITVDTGSRVYTYAVRMVRRAARLRGCLGSASKTCPTCPPEKPTPTPLGDQCSACRDSGVSFVRDTLPPPPVLTRGYLLGTAHLVPLPPSSVAIPAPQALESARAVPPLKRSPLDPWQQRECPLEAA